MMSEKQQSNKVTEIHERDPWRTIRMNADGIEVTHQNGSKTGIRLDDPETRRKVARGLAPDLVPMPQHADLVEAMHERVQRESFTVTDGALASLAEAALFVWREREAEEAAIAAFKEAWHEADGEGASGDRVRRGLRAALAVMKEQGR